MTPPSTRHPHLDGRMRRIITSVVLCGAALVFGTLVAFGRSTAFSVGIGAAVAAANLWLLARIVTSLLPGEHAGETDGAEARTRSSQAWALVLMLKMFGLFGGVWLLMHQGAVSTLPMLIGFGSLPIGIAIGSIVSDRSGDPGDR